MLLSRAKAMESGSLAKNEGGSAPLRGGASRDTKRRRTDAVVTLSEGRDCRASGPRRDGPQKMRRCTEGRDCRASRPEAGWLAKDAALYRGDEIAALAIA